MSENNRVTQLLQKQVEEIEEYFKTTYNIYMKWYSSFITINLLALARISL